MYKLINLSMCKSIIRMHVTISHNSDIFVPLSRVVRIIALPPENGRFYFSKQKKKRAPRKNQ